VHNKNALRHIKGSDILNRHRPIPVDDVHENRIGIKNALPHGTREYNPKKLMGRQGES